MLVLAETSRIFSGFVTWPSGCNGAPGRGLSSNTSASIVGGADPMARLERYAELDAQVVRDLGADRMPPAHRVVGGREWTRAMLPVRWRRHARSAARAMPGLSRPAGQDAGDAYWFKDAGTEREAIEELCTAIPVSSSAWRPARCLASRFWILTGKHPETWAWWSSTRRGSCRRGCTARDRAGCTGVDRHRPGLSCSANALDPQQLWPSVLSGAKFSNVL